MAPGICSTLGTIRSPGMASISCRCSGGQTVSGSSVQQSSGWIGHQSGCFTASSYTTAMSPRLVSYQELLVGTEQRAQLGVLRLRLERLGLQVSRLHTGHAELADGAPQRLRHRRLVGQRTEVAVLHW